MRLCFPMNRSNILDLKLACESANLAKEIKAVRKWSATGQSDATCSSHELIERIEDVVRRASPGITLDVWELAVAGLQVLVNREDCLRIARTREGNLLEERARGDVFSQDFRRKLSSEQISLPKGLEKVRQSLLETVDFDPEMLCALLESVPLPTLYWTAEQPPPTFMELREEPASLEHPMVRAIVFLDQEPVASPQILKQGYLYQLTFRLRGLGWPDNAVRLRLDLNTTCPPEVYDVSNFAMEKPADIVDGQFEGEMTGYLSFQSKQSNPLDDLIFTVHTAFELEEQHLMEIPAIGHNELRIKIVDTPNWVPTAEGSQLDQRIVELIETLIGDHPSVRHELPDLFPLLQGLGRICAVYAQEAAFKGRTDVPERAFQKKVVHDLRLRLNPLEVQEHSQQAGGITDIRYRGVIVELKVERENRDRSNFAMKYGRQIAQYAGVEAKQVGVLLLLDLTEKVNPPGDIKNDIFLSDVPTHGTSQVPQEFPSKVIVFVVHGNTRNPSSYS